MIPLPPPLARLLGSTRFALALAWVLGLGAPFFGYAAAPEFWVAPSGSDAQAGTAARPFASLERARDALREVRRGGGSPSIGAVIHLSAGDFLRTNVLELTAADSGSPEAPVIWRADPGPGTRLLGGRLLPGFQAVEDPAVISRFPEEARGKIRQCDLRALGIREFGDLKSRGFGRPTTAAHSELFFAGRPMTLARWPNEGAFESIAGFPTSTAQGDDHGGSIGSLEGGFLYAGDRPHRWKDPTGVWVHGYWAWDWANSYEQVASLDPEKRWIQTASPHGLYGFRKGQRFYFLNVLEELDQPGEWFLDRTAGRLYFWPPADFSAGAEALLSLLDGPMLRLNDASHVVIQGLTLEATRGNGVEIRGGTSNRIAGCILRNIGNNGVVVDGGTGHGVVDSDLLDQGDGGVSLTGGDRQTLRPGGHFVENCHFVRQGRWSRCYAPAIQIYGVGQRASHNLIEQHPHAAILFWGNDHLMDFNEIHHIALETGDVGAIYTGRDFSFRGNRIVNNFIHETGGVGMGSMGVYMDDCVSGTEISGNVFYRVQRAAFLGGGRDHQVVNNVFVDCDPAVQVDGRGLDRSPVWRDMVDKTMRASLEQVPLALYRTRYPAMKSLDAVYGPRGGPALTRDAFKGAPPANNVVARNVASGKWLEVGWNATAGMILGEGNVTAGDPGWVKTPGSPVRATDFELRSDSPAWQKGFQKLPLDQMGLRRYPARSGLPPSSGSR